jgi:hypothetical protein
MSTKLGRLLEATAKRLASEDPAAPVDVVITPRRQEEMNAIIQELQAVGGRAIEVSPESVHCQVPSGQVQRLAESDLISEIRPARIHKMH